MPGGPSFESKRSRAGSVNVEPDARKRDRDRAKWLRRLAEPTDTIDAARALWSIDVAAAKQRLADANIGAGREDEVARTLAELASALAMMVADLDRLIAAWIDRFVEQLAIMRRDRELFTGALEAGERLPTLDMGNLIAVHQLQNALQAVGDRIDPHIGPIVEALGSLDPDADDHLMAALEFAGPAATRAVDKLMAILRDRGISRWPSHVARALANASRFDDGVIPALTDLLSSHENRMRNAAIEVLGTIGPAARPAAGQLLALDTGDESERCRMIWALSQQGAPTPEVLAVLDAAMRDDDGYVRRSAVHALGELTPDSARFVPWLIAACDWADDLHDESLPEAAVTALGQYGPRALVALHRLRQFVDGPIRGRTVNPALVREAIARIAGDNATVPDALIPYRPSEPFGDDESLFAVRYRGKLCYIDRLGRIVLETRYWSGGPFSDGRAIVYNDAGRAIVIDREGRVVVQSDWNEIRPFSEGLAAACKASKWGFVDREGRVVIEPQFDSVTAFSEGLAGFELGRTHENLSKGISWACQGRRGFIDYSGSVVIPAEWINASPFHEGRAVVCTGGTMKPNPILGGRELLSNRKYGYLDRTGRLLIPGEFDMALSFSDGMAVVQIGDFSRRARHGYIDAVGKRVIPLKLTAASDFQNGLAIVRRRGRKWRETTLVINPSGQVISAVPYRRVQPFSEGLAAALTGDLYGFIDIKGCWVIEPQFDTVGPFTNGLAGVERGDWYGLVDNGGNFVWGPTTEGSMHCEIETEWSC
jgi:WG containing repeat/HEAT repeats